MKKNELQALFVKAVETLDLKNPDHVKVLAGLTDVMRENEPEVPLNPSVEAPRLDLTLLGPGRLDIPKAPVGSFDNALKIVSASKEKPKYTATFDPSGQGRLFDVKKPRRRGPIPYFTREVVLNAIKASKNAKEVATRIEVETPRIYSLIKKHDLFNEAEHIYQRAVRHTKEDFESVVRTSKTVEEVRLKCGYAGTSAVYRNLLRWDLKLAD